MGTHTLPTSSTFSLHTSIKHLLPTPNQQLNINKMGGCGNSSCSCSSCGCAPGSCMRQISYFISQVRRGYRHCSSHHHETLLVDVIKYLSFDTPYPSQPDCR